MVIDGKRIESLLKESPSPSRKEVLSILRKAEYLRGLSIEDTALLLKVEDPDLISLIHSTAGRVKERVFGRRIVLFVPLYLSNYCTNGCVYCGFRAGNMDIGRKALSVDEIVEEARVLERRGFRRVLLVCGEDNRWGVDYIVDAVRAIYRHTDIRIVHVNAPPMDVEDLRRLKSSGVGVYQVFQETYHIPTYRKMHLSGRKRDYTYRLEVMDRAIEAGFQDVGIGALLGLYDYRYDCLATVAHSIHLYERFGTHAHTISIPRLRPAKGALLREVPHPVTDVDIKKIVSIYRLSVPSAGVVVSTREPSLLRDELIRTGATQLSAGSSTTPGGYAHREDSIEQFSINDGRSLEEVMVSIARAGFLPSLCTSCYRSGRVGSHFTETTMEGGIKRFCQANAVLTLKEYIEDHARNGCTDVLKRAVTTGIRDIEDPSLREKVAQRLNEIEEGRRDIYF